MRVPNSICDLVRMLMRSRMAPFDVLRMDGFPLTLIRSLLKSLAYQFII